MYPEANIWIIGHSLGGALASLLGATFGVPVVAFESPGEKMAAARLHLPSPVSARGCERNSYLIHVLSPPPNTLLIYGIRPIRCQTAFATVLDPHVTLEDMLWNLGMCLMHSESLVHRLISIARCHLGQIKRYDTVNKLGWSVDLRTHAIKVVIDSVLNEDWEPADENGNGGREVPASEDQADCVVGHLPFLPLGVV
jgi:lipase ATG15